ncbi:hypothetical protein Ancab_001693 [Ancistrocladus abbreviatus]
MQNDYGLPHPLSAILLLCLTLWVFPHMRQIGSHPFHLLRFNHHASKDLALCSLNFSFHPLKLNFLVGAFLFTDYIWAWMCSLVGHMEE